MLDNRSVRIGSEHLASQTCNSVSVVRLENDILEVQASDRSACSAEERSCQTLNSVAVSVYGLRVALDWSPSLACHIDIGDEQCVVLQCCCLSCKLQQGRLILNYEERCSRNIADVVAKLAQLARLERVLVACLNGCVHHAAVNIVQSKIELVVNTCRNSQVQVAGLRSELQALAKRILHKRLRVSCRSNLACSVVDCERTRDRSAVSSRNLCHSELCVTHNTDLEDAGEVFHSNSESLLAVAVHCSNTTREGCVVGVCLLLCKEHLTSRSCRVGDAVRGFHNARNRECCNRAIACDCCGVRLNAVYRNLVALAPEYGIEVTSLFAELGTRLLQREGNLGLTRSTYIGAEVFGCIGDTRKRYQRYNKSHENFHQIFHLGLRF